MVTFDLLLETATFSGKIFLMLFILIFSFNNSKFSLIGSNVKIFPNLHFSAA